MLESYKIENVDGEEFLYLYLDINYEFANELSNDNLQKKASNYLATHNIKFNGQKVIFVINGIETKMIDLNKKKVYLNDKIILVNSKKLKMEEVLLGLLFSNINFDLEFETLKALTVLYRSEVIRNLHNDVLVNSDFSLNYNNYEFYKDNYPKTFAKYYDIYLKVIKDTCSEYLIYNDEVIKCYTHLVSNGYTEDELKIPYLKRRESLFDLTYPNYLQRKKVSFDELRHLLNLNSDEITFKITNISNSNRVKKIEINGKEFEASLMAALIKLPSTDMTIVIGNKEVIFITRGIGNGLGLSIFGANFLANLKLNYKQILNYYFDGVKLVVIK